MNSDKNTIIGLLLVGLVILFTYSDFYKSLIYKPAHQAPEQVYEPENQEELPQETTPPVESLQQEKVPAKRDPLIIDARASDSEKRLLEGLASDYMLSFGDAEEQIVRIETPLYSAEISSRGPSLFSWTLKNYLGPDSLPVQLINEKAGNLFLGFPIQGDTLTFKNVVFDVSFKSQNLDLTEANPEGQIKLSQDLGGGRIVELTLLFHYDSYSFDLAVNLRGLEQFVDGLSYSLYYAGGLNYSEKNIRDDMRYAKAYVMAQNEIDNLDVGSESEARKELTDWTINWTAVRTKYFTAAILPGTNSANGVILTGGTEKLNGDDLLFKKYSLELLMPYARKTTSDTFKIYLGPLEYSTLHSYGAGLENMMDFGWKYIIRPLGKVVLYSITRMYKVIPNYGLVIILFSLLVKIILYPLTKKSYQSMKEMQKIQPLMQELRKKYADEPQKMNAEMMNLYREHGVNPLGGCLPMFLQLPLLYALFQVFRTTIEFRGAAFVGWITDLSQPDTVYELPFTIPLYGSGVNILPLIMGATMFLQQKTTVSDPKQKAMVYFMPVIFTFMFNTFPSGLTLYYTLFNILTIIFQKFIPDKPIEKKKKKISPARKGKMSRIDMMRRMRQNR